MEPDHTETEVPIASNATVLQAKRQLMVFLTDNTAPLLGTLRSYVQRMGLARREEAPAMALEVLQEVVVEALAHIERFDATRQPMAWLLGIAINVIKRKKTEAARRYQREFTFGRLAMMRPEPFDESELLDQLLPFTLSGPEQDIEADEQANLLLSLVAPEDQRILRLAVLNDFERSALAQELGITPVAARVRLHRALNRLRLAWNELQTRQQQMENRATFERKKL